jgi:hypothetical protein
MAAIDISSMMSAIGDCFLGKKVVPKKMGVIGIAGLLSGKFGHDKIGVLILDCQMRMEVRSSLLSSESDPCLRGSVSPACLSLE